MNDVKLLDCTLRDGGYINNWNFSPKQILSTVQNLTNAELEYIEFGYLTSIFHKVNGSQFQSIETASKFIPENRRKSKYLLMADVSEFDTGTLCYRDVNTIDGIRVVFYKRQIEQAAVFCENIIKKGYDLFLQPMVTIDYTGSEFNDLIKQFTTNYIPYAISVVDSFGCMTSDDIFRYICVMEKCVNKDVKIGFHGHDNMQLTQVNAVSIFEHKSEHDYIVDSSVSGMGRGAGNLCTEWIVNYANLVRQGKYDIDSIIPVISEVTEPLSREEQWGYSPYFFLTAQKGAHPNFATYLLMNHDISVSKFKEYLDFIPSDMLTKCTRPYVEEVYESFCINDDM